MEGGEEKLFVLIRREYEFFSSLGMGTNFFQD